MSALAHVGSFAAGLVGTGLLLAVASTRTGAPEPVAPEPVDEPTSEAPLPPWVRVDCPEESDRGRELVERERLLGERQAELEAMQAEEEEATGAPMAWPEQVPAGYGEAEVEATLDELTARYGAEVVGIDCGEYPCVAVIGLPGGDMARKAELVDALDGPFPNRYHNEMLWLDDAGENIAGFGLMVALTPTEEEAGGQRVGFRTEEIGEIFSPVDHFSDP